MHHWITGAVLALTLTFGTAGSATPGQDLVTAALRDQGFEVTLVHWTWLGRIRIIAVSDDIRREIVINPNTGEILRDYSQRVAAAVVETGGNRENDVAAASEISVEPTRLSDDVDASAMTALEEMGMGLAAPLVAEPGQN